MSLRELCTCILAAWEVAVEWLRGVMLRQQNNEGPSSSDSHGPTDTDSANTQKNTIDADHASKTEIRRDPVAVQVEPNRTRPNNQQGKGNSQVNEIKANSATDCTVEQKPTAVQGLVASNLRSPAVQGLVSSNLRSNRSPNPTR